MTRWRTRWIEEDEIFHSVPFSKWIYIAYSNNKIQNLRDILREDSYFVCVGVTITFVLLKALVPEGWSLLSVITGVCICVYQCVCLSISLHMPENSGRGLTSPVSPNWKYPGIMEGGPLELLPLLFNFLLLSLLLCFRTPTDLIKWSLYTGKLRLI